MLKNYDLNDIIKKNKYKNIEYTNTLYLENEDKEIIEEDEKSKLMKLTKEELINIILQKIN
jgi:ribosomal protein L14E/L6E/L27E